MSEDRSKRETERLASATEAVDNWRQALQRSPALWERWLRVQASAPGFLAETAVLLALQTPDRQVGDGELASVRAWNGVGRHIVKGEHGAAALVPVTEREYYAVQDGESPRRLQNRSEPLETGERLHAVDVRTGVKVSYLFSRDQTAGRELPQTIDRRQLHDASQFRNLAVFARDAGSVAMDVPSGLEGSAFVSGLAAGEVSRELTDKEKLMWDLEQHAYRSMSTDPRWEGAAERQRQIEAAAVASIVAQAHGVKPPQVTDRHAELRATWLRDTPVAAIAFSQAVIGGTAERVIDASPVYHVPSGGLRELRQELRREREQQQTADGHEKWAAIDAEFAEANDQTLEEFHEMMSERFGPGQ